MTPDEFLAEIREKKGPAPLEKLAAFEQAIGHALPDDYRQFLVACNGGSVGGSLWFKERTPDGGTGDAGVHHVGGFREEYCFSLEQRRAMLAGRIPKDLLWIMDDPFGNAICVGLTGPQRGRVCFWDHETELDDDGDGIVESSGNVYVLANSFNEFVAGLRRRERLSPAVGSSKRAHKPWWRPW